MANLTVVGDIIQLKSELTRAEIELARGYEHNALKIIDEDGNESFAIELGKASVSNYGICFPSEDAEGHVFVTVENTGDHSEIEKEKQEIKRRYSPILAKLILIETQVKKTLESISTLESTIDNLITFI